jgi:hypothetical protein
MKRLILGLNAAPSLLVIGASLTPKEQTSVLLGGVVASAVTVVATSWLLGFARRKQERLWPVLGAGTVCLAVIASVVIFHWPLRAAYSLSRSALDGVARDVRAGQRVVSPTRVGLFTIVEAEVSRHGIVCLWVDPHPAGKTGFVQCGPDHVPFNLWSMVCLDDRWQFIAED